jgi:hypothetical protein
MAQRSPSHTNRPIMVKSPLPGYNELLVLLKERLSPKRCPLLIAVDGPCGVGKSTLASWLCWQLEMPSAHLDLYLIRDTDPQRWRTDDLQRVINARIDNGRPVIVEGVLLLDVLAQIDRSPDFLIYIRGESTDLDEDIAALAPNLHRVLREYGSRQQPEKRAQFVLDRATHGEVRNPSDTDQGSVQSQ